MNDKLQNKIRNDRVWVILLSAIFFIFVLCAIWLGSISSPNAPSTVENTTCRNNYSCYEQFYNFYALKYIPLVLASILAGVTLLILKGVLARAIGENALFKYCIILRDLFMTVFGVIILGVIGWILLSVSAPLVHHGPLCLSTGYLDPYYQLSADEISCIEMMAAGRASSYAMGIAFGLVVLLSIIGLGWTWAIIKNATESAAARSDEPTS
jgi:hypothetical protein